MSDYDYADLAGRVAAEGMALVPGTALRGHKAAVTARGLLQEATGAASLEELTRVALGRPSLEAPSGSSPTVRARVPQALKDRISELAARQRRKESEIVREALAAYIQNHAA